MRRSVTERGGGRGRVICGEGWMEILPLVFRSRTGWLQWFCMKSDIRLRAMSFFMYETSCSGFGERFPRLHPGKEEESPGKSRRSRRREGGSHPRPLPLPLLRRCLVSEKKPPDSDTPIPRTNNHSTIGTRIERAEAEKNREFPAWHRSSDEARIQIGAAPNTRQVMRGYLHVFFVLYSFYEDVFHVVGKGFICTLMWRKISF